MLPNQSHAPAKLAYHSPASPPTTAALVDLQSTIDSLGRKISRCPLVNCDTRNLQDAAEDMDRLLDLVMSLSQRIGNEIADRRRDAAPTYKVTAVGLMLLDPRPVLSPEDRVRLAEQEAQAEAHTYQYTPGVDAAPHPFAVGGCDVAIHAHANTSLGERRCG